MENKNHDTPQDSVNILKKQLDAVLNVFSDTIILFDKNGVVLDFQCGARDHWLHRSNFTIGEKINLEKENATLFNNAFERVQHWNEKVTFEYRVTVNYVQNWFEAHLLPFAPDQSLCLIRNISARKHHADLLKSHVHRLTSINQLATLLNKHIKPSDIVDIVLKRMMEETDSESVWMMIGDQEGLIIVRNWTVDGNRADLTGTFVDIPPDSDAYNCMRDLKSVLSKDFKVRLISEKQELDFKHNNTAILPLAYHGKLQGMVVLFHSEKGILKTNDLEFLESFAGLLNTSLDRADRIESLERSEAFLDSLFAQSPVSAWISDASGTMVRMNDACKKLFNLEEERPLIGKYNVFKDDFLKKQDLTKHFRQAFVEAVPVQIMMDYTFKDNGHAPIKNSLKPWVRCSIFPIKDSSNRVSSLIVQYYDLTTERNLRDQLLQAQKMESVGTLAGGIAHDFNNLLTGILANATYLKERLDTESLEYKVINQMERAAEMASSVVKQLLAFSRKDLSVTQAISINTVVKSVVELLRYSFPQDIAISQILSDEELFVLGDHVQLNQVFLNISINARDAMPDGGELSIKVSREHISESQSLPYGFPSGEYVKIDFHDTGMGIQGDLLNRIFDPFFTTKPASKGTGLGLSVAYNIVNRCNGWIECDSKINEGTTFSIYLPIAKYTTQTEPNLSSTISLCSECILVADDEQVVLQSADQILKMHGFTILTAENGEQLLNVLTAKTDSINLLIMDLNMPGLTAIQTFHRAKEIKPDLKILLSSGYDFSSDIDELIKLGVDGFLPKPYRASELIKKVREILDKH